MTTSQYETYEWSYDRMHSEDFEFWFERESLSDDEFVTEVSPEWAAFDVTGWKTYRDAHAYENTDSVVMSVSLDGLKSIPLCFPNQRIRNFSSSSMLGTTPEEEMQAFKTKCCSRCRHLNS